MERSLPRRRTALLARRRRHGWHFCQPYNGECGRLPPSGKGPQSSINFITSHDGFTLNDLVSYSRKHNEANGEGNRDGLNENFSDGYGAEGETPDSQTEAIRRRQVKNFLVTLFISRGVPMLLGGDEFRRTQRGNNNAYCQDNPISWYDWTLLERNREIYRFTHGMIAFRAANPVLSKDAFYTDGEIRWLSAQGATPNWTEPAERRVACLIYGGARPDLYMIFNAATEPARFILPPAGKGRRWCLAVDTFKPSPLDLAEPGSQLPLPRQDSYLVAPRSSVILVTE